MEITKFEDKNRTQTTGSGKDKKSAWPRLDQASESFIRWVGSLSSIVTHTIFFILAFVAGFWGIDWSVVLLVLTTIVSLEAIYLAIFIQMSINQNTGSLAEVEEDIDEIMEDIEEISEEEKEVGMLEEQSMMTLANIEESLTKLTQDITKFKRARIDRAESSQKKKAPRHKKGSKKTK